MTTTPSVARDTLYTVLMLDGVHGRGHTPDRSEKASGLIDGYRYQVLTEEAERLRAHCPDHGTAETSFMTCQCPAADNLLNARTTQES